MRYRVFHSPSSPRMLQDEMLEEAGEAAEALAQVRRRQSALFGSHGRGVHALHLRC